MTAAAHSHGQVLLAPEIDRADHIRHIGAAHDERGMFIDHGIIDLTCHIVLSIAWLDHLATHLSAQPSDCLSIQ